jgi:DNA-binding helix-hairpin-helix protein with protein kinase domain
MTLPQLFAGGKPIKIDRQIGKGGEGEVYALADHKDYALKFYTLPDLASREAKVTAMIKAKLADEFKLVSFPTAIVADQNKRFAGFIMRLVPDCKPLYELYAPGSRKNHFPKADYRFLTRAALNIARAVAQVHESGCVIGDINHSGVLVSQQATAALIDADSFQITENGVRHLCKVGVFDYTPPELQGKALDQVTRTPNHDAFGLAIVIFLLLFMGKHPFSGRFSGEGDMPMERAIKEHRFAYSIKRQTGLSPPPGASDLTDVPPWLGDMFEQAFGPQGQSQRPTAAQWVAALERFEETLNKCAGNALHYYSNAAKVCPWCDMEQNIGIVLFVPDAATFTAQAFSGGSFNAEQLWRQIEAMNLPALANLPLPGSQLVGQVSVASQEAKRHNKSLFGKRVAIVLGAIALWLFKPESFLYFAGAAAFVWYAIGSGSKDKKPFTDALDAASQKWVAGVTQWHSSLNLKQIATRRADIEAWKKEYQGLKGEHNSRIAEVARLHKERQLDDYLDGFEIGDEMAKGRLKVKGLGRGKLAALISYNIETFADVSEEDCLEVPGIGQAITSGLMRHRTMLASKFRPSTQMSISEKQDRMMIDIDFQARSTTLQKRIEAAAQEVSRLGAQAKLLATQQNAQLEALKQSLLNAIEDVKHLGGTARLPLMPSVENPFLNPKRSSYAPIQRQLTPITQTTAQGLSPPSCPQCGSVMHKRVTRRRRRGVFWGCSTYPLCRGTRPYP